MGFTPGGHALVRPIPPLDMVDVGAAPIGVSSGAGWVSGKVPNQGGG